MNQKLRRFIEPGLKLYLTVLSIFAVLTLFFSWQLAAVEFAAILILIIYAVRSAKRSQRGLLEYIESLTYDVDAAKSDSLVNFPFPMVVFRLEDYCVIWANQEFFDICGIRSPTLDLRITDIVPGFTHKWMTNGRSQCPDMYLLGERRFTVFGNIAHGSDLASHDYMGTAYWLDVTEAEEMREHYRESRPVVSIIVMDNYDELLKNLGDRAKNELRTKLEDTIGSWCEGRGGLFVRADRDRYLFVFEEQHLTGLIEDKFSILESVHSVVNTTGLRATVSIGIGKDGGGFEECYAFAEMALEMAMTRGGDQAVIKNRYNFEFFGGRGHEVERRTKIKSRVMANALSELITDSTRIYVMGHRFADFDSLGGAVGVCCIARKRGIPAYIVMDPDRNSCGPLLERLKESPEYAWVFVTPQEALIEADSGTLLVIVDTNRPEQVEDESLLQTCHRVAVIDHHRRAATYIQDAVLSFHEPYASSVCELVTDLLRELVDPEEILDVEAEAMMAGMVMDTKTFTLRTGERTFDAAAFLSRAGASTQDVKLMLQSDLKRTIARYRILQEAEIYRDSIAIASPPEPQDRVVAAQAADELLNILGVTASVVAYPTESGGVSMSARSIGEVNVQVILEGLGGGGNRSSAGVQLESITLDDAVAKLYEIIDDYLAN